MDYINKVKLPISYYAFNNNWNLLDRDDKADIIMRYIDNVELEFKNRKEVIDSVAASIILDTYLKRIGSGK